MGELTCPTCGWEGIGEDCDGAGACPGCVFCPRCNTECDETTGKKHKLGLCCVDTLHGTGEKVQNKELLRELKESRTSDVRN